MRISSILYSTVIGLACVLSAVPKSLAQAAPVLVDIASDQTDPDNLADAEPSIAVNPVDPSKLAVVTFSGFWLGSNSAPVWKSDDGGTTWRKVFQIPQPTSNRI